MPFPCPACRAAVDGSLELGVQRCPGCGARLRSRAVPSDGPALVYEVEVAGAPHTRQRVEVPWDAAQERRLAAWLLWGSAVTLSLVGLLYLLARLLG